MYSYILSVLVAVSWVPIMLRFYRDYMKRPEDERHPASLAIISMQAVLVFHALSVFVIQKHGWAGWELTRTIILVAELYTVLQFWFAFKVGQKKPLVRGREN